MTARRPADIAADVRAIARVIERFPLSALDLNRLADELDAHAAEHVCVPKDRWPTADEIAGWRERVEQDHARARHLRGLADAVDGPVSRALDEAGNHLHDRADDIAAFLDRLDPPQPEPQADDDVDPWALLADVVTDETLTIAEVKRRLVAARAALDARGQR